MPRAQPPQEAKVKLEQAVIKEECAVPVVKAESSVPCPKAEPSTAELPVALSQNTTPFPDLLRPSPKECTVRLQGVHAATCLRTLVSNLRTHRQSRMPSRAGSLQAARDALAALHGEPEVASHLQHSILDSLVCLLRSKLGCLCHA